jgi:hypothetical protein
MQFFTAVSPNNVMKLLLVPVIHQQTSESSFILLLYQTSDERHVLACIYMLQYLSKYEKINK